MSAEIRVCRVCHGFTMSATCGKCDVPTAMAHPAKFSPDDRYGKYRRKSIEEEYGENGKHDRNPQ